LINTKNTYTRNIPPCTGKRFVISDIHGCFNTFRTLIEKIEFQTSDQLFLLGDYVDRGPLSVEVVDLIIELQAAGNQVYPLIGNHEEELMLFPEFNSVHYVQAQIEANNLTGFFNDDYKFKDKYLKFFNSLSYYFELDDFILVHAGFDFENSKPFEDKESMTFIRNWQYKEKPAKGKTIIHGHTPRKFDEIYNKIQSRFNIMPLDNGCVFNRFKNMGNLLCLRLNDFELFVQPNIDAG